MQDGWITAGFNALNQPTAMWSKLYAGSPTWMFFGYDPLGRCVKRWKGAGSAWTPGYNPATYFYYDGWNLVQEGGSNAAIAERVYVHGGRIDEIVASNVSGIWYNHHYDAQGNCILLSTASGGLAAQFDYDAFGYPYFYNATGGKGVALTRFLFTGREWINDMRLYDYRNRIYQPELGRFLQPDPKHFAAGDYNLYRYCHNDPVNKTDPFGLDTAIAIGGARWDSWGDSPNPLGHASLALTSQGTFSFGTGTMPGTNFTSFLGDQSAHRWTAVYILKTTPAQDAAIKRNLEDSREKGKLPDIFKDPAGAYKDNCATRTRGCVKRRRSKRGSSKNSGRVAA